MCMDIKTEIRESQRQLLDLLAQYEALISELYAAYARIFPDNATFWQALSREESAHERFLKSLHKLLDAGTVFYNLDRFNVQTIRACMAEVQTGLAAAKQDTISLPLALETALSIEKSVLDGHFYDIVKTDAPEFSVIADHLAKDTNRHRGLIQDKYNACKGINIR